MYKLSLIGIVIAASVAISSPAKAGDTRYGQHFDRGHGPVAEARFNRHRNWVSPRKIRRKVRRFGCYDISPVRRTHRFYKVKATCDDGLRVRMVFSVRSGRLLRERVIGYEPRRRNRHWRG